MERQPNSARPDAPISLRARLLESRWVALLANFPPVAWLLRRGGRLVGQRAIRVSIYDTMQKRRPRSLDEKLRGIAVDVVESLGYVGAMVAPYEAGDALPVRAIHVDPRVASIEQIQLWEEAVSQIAGKPVSITDPRLARVYVHDDYYASNLSVKATTSRRSATSDELFSLFTPFAPAAARPLVKGIQDALGITEVIAVPFFAGDELVGNLFAAKRGQVTPEDRATLEAFGRQAAAAIESERSRQLIDMTQKLTYAMQSSLESETAILDLIVQGVVEYFDYAGAMVATLEDDGSLPVRAVHIDPRLASEEQVAEWQATISNLIGQRVDFSDPDYARVYLNDPAYERNLAYIASTKGKPIEAEDLFSLFTPVLPEAARPAVMGVQEAMGIRRVIAVPFFAGEKMVGNLFAASRSLDFNAGERAALELFGQQAAMGIRNARLYRASEDRRQVAQVFGKMAFTSAAYLHELRNHIGLAKLNLDMLKDIQSFPPDAQQQLLGLVPTALQRLNQTTSILDHLHQPWRQMPDEPTDVNLCIKRAIEKINRGPGDANVDFKAGTDLPPVLTSPEMLIEIFRILFKNALEAIQESGRSGKIQIESRYIPDETQLEVVIQDSGIGIRPEHLSRIFELKYTTKEYGMGFGLFWARDYIVGLGGTIAVSSVPDKGSTFTLRLPRYQSGWVGETAAPEAVKL
jgi:signal transduction histidine kinase